MLYDRMRDKFRGGFLGTFVGDAVGVPVEGFTHDQLSEILDAVSRLPKDSEARAETEALLGLISNPAVFPDDSAPYSDDTQMMIGVAESLVERGRFDGPDMASRFVENFQVWRGYGAGAFAVLSAIKDGMAWDEAGGLLFSGQGSFGNGGAMRVSPAGLWAHKDPFVLRHLAENQAKITHTHPLGIGGAALQAAAVAVACRNEPGRDFDPLSFLDEVERFAPGLPVPYQYALRDIREFLADVPATWDAQERLGSSIEAHESVPAALYAFLRLPHSFESAVTWAVRLGDDTDTVGAMTGAIAGAFHGYSAIPGKWLRALENGPKGRDYTVGLADKLWDRWRAQR
ncbi:MAG: ADP-ribosylglycohydrolase family protein [Akkermansiaceae bacterium]|nr:ADP-ribosylglycohydrolase family protein [Armatimonadota bacterium]